jgi:hypothetical protein
MNLTLLITINAVLDTAIISALAYVMSRSARLAPHRPDEPRPASAHRRAARTSGGPRRDRVGARLGTVLD